MEIGRVRECFGPKKYDPHETQPHRSVAAILPHTPTLEKLEMWPAFTDDHIPQLTRFTQLKDLSLIFNNISQAGLLQLKRSMPNTAIDPAPSTKK